MRVLAFDVGTKTLSYCCLEAPGGGPIEVHLWETIDVHAEAGLGPKAKPTMKEDAEYVIQALWRRESDMYAMHPDAVVIEQQPAGGHNRFSSVRMKVLSHVIHSFFYMCSVPAPVGFVTPASKLAGMRSKETAEQAAARRGGDRKTMGAKYRDNKRFAVDTVTGLLARVESPRFHHLFEAAKPKQDDLADAFLLAHAYCLKHNK
jgi:hypothetical protein